ncbi:MAG TPA: tyrosine--tRNA ligase, partial [Candidatus Paceibacterota bacterium]|nr:tyrosine--tRNA ligase [Candidatus Paceibacterota bacterium]
RGVDKIYPSKEELEQALRSGKKLRLYQGFDPTGTKLHVGHLVGLRKLADWQALGHEVIFLIGDGTGQAGDPSGKTRSREKFLSRKELRKNAKDYVKQAGKILRFSGKNKIRVLFNGDWLNKLKLPEILNIAGNFSWQQLSERDLFQERISKGETLSLREALYPLLQAYDSVAMGVDLEVGGSDQTFNMLFGRSLLKSMKGKDKFVMTTPLLTDSSGRKIGKTEGNVIALDDKPEELFGKIMTFPDEVIVKCFEYLTRVPMDEIKKIEEKISAGENPMPFKKQLAYKLVEDLHGKDAAGKAQGSFESAFQKKEIPEDAREVEAKGMMLETLVSAGAVESASAGRRLFDAGAITDLTLDKKTSAKDAPESGHTYKIGKHTFIKIK